MGGWVGGWMNGGWMEDGDLAHVPVIRLLTLFDHGSVSLLLCGISVGNLRMLFLSVCDWIVPLCISQNERMNGLNG